MCCFSVVSYLRALQGKGRSEGVRMSPAPPSERPLLELCLFASRLPPLTGKASSCSLCTFVSLISHTRCYLHLCRSLRSYFFSSGSVWSLTFLYLDKRKACVNEAFQGCIFPLHVPLLCLGSRNKFTSFLPFFRLAGHTLLRGRSFSPAFPPCLPHSLLPSLRPSLSLPPLCHLD